MAFLRIYKVKIDWAFDKDSKDHPKTINPTLKIHYMGLDTHCLPEGFEVPDVADAMETSQYILTHLEMVPPAMEKATQEYQFPSIITVFKNTTSISIGQAGPARSSLAPSTLLWAWKMVAHRPAPGCLASGFNQLSAKMKTTDSARSRAYLSIEKHSSTPIHNNVLAVTPFRNNTILAVAFADGTVAWLDHEEKQAIQPNYNFTEITSLAQSGFAFEGSEPAIHLDLSPNGCLIAYQDVEGALKLRHMENVVSSLESPSDGERRTAIATALALQYDSGLMQFHAFLDDIISLMGPSTDTELVYEFLEQVYAGVGLSLDFSSEDGSKATRVLFSPAGLVQKVIGAQAVLGSFNRGRRPMSAKLAFVTLQLRLSAYVVMMTVRTESELKPGKCHCYLLVAHNANSPHQKWPPLSSAWSNGASTSWST
jgi:mediator of RNA polymerase II transcription subunit 16, fungi type